MTKPFTQLMKLALKRDESVPIGRPAPLHLDCPCGTRVDVSAAVVTCKGCGTHYDDRGWTVWVVH